MPCADHRAVAQEDAQLDLHADRVARDPEVGAEDVVLAEDGSDAVGARGDAVLLPGGAGDDDGLRGDD